MLLLHAHAELVLLSTGAFEVTVLVDVGCHEALYY